MVRRPMFLAMPPIHAFGVRQKNPTPTVRRKVIVSKLKPQRTLWAFGYLDIAALLGVKPSYVRQMVCKNVLDPGDLEALCKAWAARAGYVDGSDPEALLGALHAFKLGPKDFDDVPYQEDEEAEEEAEEETEKHGAASYVSDEAWNAPVKGGVSEETWEEIQGTLESLNAWHMTATQQPWAVPLETLWKESLVKHPPGMEGLLKEVHAKEEDVKHGAASHVSVNKAPASFDQVIQAQVSGIAGKDIKDLWKETLAKHPEVVAPWAKDPTYVKKPFNTPQHGLKNHFNADKEPCPCPPEPVTEAAGAFQAKTIKMTAIGSPTIVDPKLKLVPSTEPPETIAPYFALSTETAHTPKWDALKQQVPFTGHIDTSAQAELLAEAVAGLAAKPNTCAPEDPPHVSPKVENAPVPFLYDGFPPPLYAFYQKGPVKVEPMALPLNVPPGGNALKYDALLGIHVPSQPLPLVVSQIPTAAEEIPVPFYQFYQSLLPKAGIEKHSEPPYVSKEAAPEPSALKASSTSRKKATETSEKHGAAPYVSSYLPTVPTSGLAGPQQFPKSGKVSPLSQKLQEMQTAHAHVMGGSPYCKVCGGEPGVDVNSYYCAGKPTLDQDPF